MANTVKIELTEQEVQQLLVNAQRGYANENGLSREQQAAYNRAVGKLQIAWAEALQPSQKRPYTRRAVANTGASTGTGKRRGRPRKNAPAQAANTSEG